METSIEYDIISVNKLTGNLEHRKGPLQNFVWLLYLLKLPEITYIIHELHTITMQYISYCDSHYWFVSNSKTCFPLTKQVHLVMLTGCS